MKLSLAGGDGQGPGFGMLDPELLKVFERETDIVETGVT